MTYGTTIEKGLVVYIITENTIDTFRNELGADQSVSDAYLMAKIGQKELTNLAQLTPDGGIIDAEHENLRIVGPNFEAHRAEALKKALSDFLPQDRFVSHGNLKRREVALTFDDGPHPLYTAKILDILQYYGVQATFFCVGLQIQCHPDLVKKEYEQLHLVANHTWSHPGLPSLPNDRINWQLTHSNDTIKQIIGVRPTFFRPPYGAFDINTLSSANALDLTTVLWNVHSYDWRCLGSNAIVSTVLDQVEPGSIILMHDGGGNRSQTVEALLVIIENLLQNNLHLVTVQQLCANLSQ